jgi:hypothetical protein
MSLKAAFGYIVSRTMTTGIAIDYFYQRLPTSDDGTMINYSTASSIGGVDLALRWTPTKKWAYTILVQNLDLLKMLSGKGPGIELQYDIGSATSLSSTLTDRFVPVITAGTRYATKLDDRPFALLCDVQGYLVDGNFTKLNTMEIRLNIGGEWKEWKTFILRAGIGDMLLNGTLFSNWKSFTEEFTPRLTLGFGADLSMVHKGLMVNYGLATDGIGAGVDQQADFSFIF